MVLLTLCLSFALATPKTLKLARIRQEAKLMTPQFPPTAKAPLKFLWQVLLSLNNCFIKALVFVFDFCAIIFVFIFFVFCVYIIHTITHICYQQNRG